MKIKLIKGLILVSILATFMFILESQSFADSPVTSSNISSSYMDLNIVKEASGGVLNFDIAKYLASPDNSIDVKAAVINALYSNTEWEFDGKQYPDLYAKLIYNKKVSDLELDKLSGDELFCLGYMTLLDDYFHPEKAVEMLQMAKDLNPDSFTVSIILALDKAQIVMDSNWYEMYVVTRQVLDDKMLVQDMRPGAVKIIENYMDSYGSYSPPQAYLSDKLQKMINNCVVLDIGNSYSYMNGYYSAIDPLDDNISPIIDNGRTLVPIRFIAESFGSKVNWDSSNSTVTIILNGKKVQLTIGDSSIFVNGQKQDIDVPAKIINDRTYIPLRAVIEEFDKNIFWDDRGLIIISNKDQIIDSIIDKALIDELVDKLN